MNNTGKALDEEDLPAHYVRFEDPAEVLLHELLPHLPEGHLIKVLAEGLQVVQEEVQDLL